MSVEAVQKLICAEPHNTTHRLVYADLIEDTDPVRAEFVRLQCELHRRGVDGTDAAECGWGGTCVCRSHEVVRRCRSILNDRPDNPMLSNGDSWATPVVASVFSPADRRQVFDWDWDRGFVGHLTVSAQDWVRCADTLTTLTPVTKVTLTTEPAIEAGGSGSHASAHKYRLAGRKRWWRDGVLGQVVAPTSLTSGITYWRVRALLALEWPQVEFAHRWPGRSAEVRTPVIDGPAGDAR